LATLPAATFDAHIVSRRLLSLKMMLSVHFQNEALSLMENHEVYLYTPV
jgi:hypothetical protein